MIISKNHADYHIQIGNRLCIGGNVKMIRFISEEGVATFFDGSEANLYNIDWNFVYHEHGESTPYYEQMLDGIEIKWSVRSSKQGVFHMARIHFKSTNQMLHFFNLVAVSNAIGFKIPDFDLREISGMGINTLYFHSYPGMLMFREVILAQETENTKLGNE